MGAGAGTLLRRMARFLPAAAAVGVAAYCGGALRSPAPLTGAVPEGRFSAGRAMRHVRAVAAEPHPVGSAAATKVREYLTGELKELGFDVEIQDAVAGNDLGPTPYGPAYRAAGRVHNVIGRVPGTMPGTAVLLMTHYDSVSQGPGASDAGVPVAALLESLRVLRGEGSLRNDLLVVFTDGEEAGLLGARAFFAEHPLAGSVGVVLNFEARGTGGPVLMFEAGPGNGPMLAELARSGVPVVASSLFDAVYRHLPNATDFAIAKERDLPGLNFANIGGFAQYHGPLDDVAHVDQSVLQHHGEIALALARRLGSADLARLTGDDSIFFPLGRGQLVRYPAVAAVPLAVGAGLVWAAGLRRQLRTGTLTGGQLASGLAGLVGRLAAGAAAGTGLVAGLGRSAPEFRRHGDFHDADEVFAGLAGLAGAAVLAGAAGSRGAATARIAAGSLPLALASTVLAARLRGGSYLAGWPLLGAGAGLWLLGTEAERAEGSPVRDSLAATLAVAPAAALFPALSRLLFKGLTPRMAGTSVVAMQLLGELAAPALAQLPRRVRQVGAAAALSLAGGVAVRRIRRRARQRRGGAAPRPETLSYLLDPQAGTALWLSTDPVVSDRTRLVLGERPEQGRLPRYFPGWQRDFLHAPAPLLKLPAPAAEVLEQRAGAPGYQCVTLRVHSPRGARQVSLGVRGGGVRRWWADGREPGRATEPVDASVDWELWLHAVPAAGVRVVLELARSDVELRVLDRVDGLPPELVANLDAAWAGRGTGTLPHSPAAALDVDTWGNASLVVHTMRISLGNQHRSSNRDDAREVK
jgi:hypothetical protein